MCVPRNTNRRVRFLVAAVLATTISVWAACSSKNTAAGPQSPIVPAPTSTIDLRLNTPLSSALGETPTPFASYPCEQGGACVCTDFPSRVEAQRVFEGHGGSNWAGLDPDQNGFVCTELP